MYRLLKIFSLVLLACTQLRSNPQPAAGVLTVTINGVIHPVVVDVLESAIAQAQREKDQVILIRLNTPGGFAEATRLAIERLVSSPVPVIIWVGPAGARAASAGFFLLEAADLAAMAPGTNTGAAHPVLLVGQPDPTMMKKIANDAAASLRSVAARRGRNAAMAESAVLESKSFTDKEALEAKLIDVIAPTEADLLRQLQGHEVARFDGSRLVLDLRDPAVREYQPSLAQRVHWAIGDPNLALALLLLGALGLYAEFTSPGLILPGVAGAILLVLGLSGMSLLPLNWTGVTLLLLALALFVLETKFTSHGVLGTGAIIAMILGAMMLVNSPIPEMRIRLMTAISLALPFGLIVMFLVTLAFKAKREHVQSGTETFAGETAVAITELTPEGQVMFHGGVWNATSTTHVSAAQRVRIRAVHGLELEVEPVSGG